MLYQKKDHCLRCDTHGLKIKNSVLYHVDRDRIRFAINDSNIQSINICKECFIKMVENGLAQLKEEGDWKESDW